MELAISQALVDDINLSVRTTAFNAEEKAEIAQLTGVTARAVQMWLAPPDAAQQRDLLPSRLVAGKNLRELPAQYQRRFEVGYATLMGAQVSSGTIGTPRQTPYGARGKGGELREYTETFASLQEALDRVTSYQNQTQAVDAFLAENWVSLGIEPTGDYTWQVTIEYLSDFESPPLGEEGEDE